jgi:hypothetical protein
MLMPSHIAPFLTPMAPSDRDEVIYYDNLERGGDFVVQWERHIGDDDHNR